MKKPNLLTICEKVRDSRSNHGKRFEFKYFFCFLIMANLAGSKSVRQIEAYFIEHRKLFNNMFDDLFWHKAPGKSIIARFINGLVPSEIIKIRNNLQLYDRASKHFHIDGKMSNCNILNVFCEETRQIILTEEYQKGKEIEAVFNVLINGNFNKNTWVTLDALHCQKKL